MASNFMLPGLYEHLRLNDKFLHLKKDHPEFFYEDTGVYAVYGNFQFCIWDGGRIFSNYHQATREDVEQAVEIYNKIHNIPMRFVFTNNQLQEKHYHDRFCNMILQVCDNPMNEIVLADDGLESYIRENYPNYKIISSTTKCLSNKELSKAELNKDYHMVCLDYNLNKNLKYLESLNEKEKEKTEFLVNAICPPGCPCRREHYRLNSIFHLNYGKPFKMSGCSIKENTLFPNTMNSYNNLSPEDIRNIYTPMGFQYYKLEGRTLSDIEVLNNYVRYMVKPEYQLYVISLLGE